MQLCVWVGPGDAYQAPPPDFASPEPVARPRSPPVKENCRSPEIRGAPLCRPPLRVGLASCLPGVGLISPASLP